MAKDRFISRHVGPRDHEIKEMLGKIGVDSLDELIDKTIPESIRLDKPLDIPDEMQGQSLLPLFNSSSTLVNCISLICNTIWALKKSLALHFAV